MNARYFTFGDRPKAVYYLTDIKSEVYPEHSIEDFYNELQTKWLSNPDTIIVDDRQNLHQNSEIEITDIEKYLSKLEELKNQLENGTF